MFESKNYSFSEVAGTIVSAVSVKRTNGSNRRVDLVFKLHDNTAVNGSDYLVVAGGLTFYSGEVGITYVLKYE